MNTTDGGGIGPDPAAEPERLRARDDSDTAARILALEAEVARLGPLAYAVPSAEWAPDGVTWRERCADLADEAVWSRADLDTACRMLAKARWRGPWDKTPEEWVAIGRLMAGLCDRDDRHDRDDPRDRYNPQHMNTAE